MLCILTIYRSTVLRTVLSESTGLFVSSGEHQGMCGHHPPLQGVYIHLCFLQTLWFRRLLDSTPGLFLVLTSLPLEGRSLTVAPALRWWFPRRCSGSRLGQCPSEGSGHGAADGTVRGWARHEGSDLRHQAASGPTGEPEGAVLSPRCTAASPGWAVQELALEPCS